MQQPLRLLFVSQHDSARAPIAAAITKHLAGDAIEVETAGVKLEPAADDVRNFYENMTGQPLPVAHQIDELQNNPFDLIITLCDKSHELVEELPQDHDHIRWDIPETHTESGIKHLEIELSERIRLMLLAKGYL